jgi:hypothetical protein
MYSHRAVNGNVIKIASMRAPGVLNPNLKYKLANRCTYTFSDNLSKHEILLGASILHKVEPRNQNEENTEYG